MNDDRRCPPRGFTSREREALDRSARHPAVPAATAPFQDLRGRAMPLRGIRA